MTRRRWIAFGVALVLAALWLHDRGVLPAEPRDSAWVRQTGDISHELTVQGHRLRVLDRGQGPAVLLLHGWCDSTYTWREQLPQLAVRYRVIALDWPGFGYSSRPPAAVGYQELARVAVGVLDALEVEQAFVVGNSMGGGAALHLAADFPERVRGLVPVDAAAPMPPADGPWLHGMLTTAGVGGTALWSMGRLAHWITLMTATEVDERLTDEVVDEMYLPFNVSGGRRAALQQFREIRGHPITPEVVARIRAPTLVIWGREDHWIPLAVGEALAADIPDARLAILDGVGHLPQWEAPAEFNRLLLEFIAGVEAEVAAAAGPEQSAE